MRRIETLQIDGKYMQANLLLKDVKPMEVSEIGITLYQQLKSCELGNLNYIIQKHSTECSEWNMSINRSIFKENVMLSP